MVDVLEEVEYRDLQITLLQDGNGYWIWVARWIDSAYVRVSEPLFTWNSDGSTPTLKTLNNYRVRQLWQIYGKHKTKDIEAEYTSEDGE